MAQSKSIEKPVQQGGVTVLAHIRLHHQFILVTTCIKRDHLNASSWLATRGTHHWQSYCFRTKHSKKFIP
jgi:hypothetical protein